VIPKNKGGNELEMRVQQNRDLDPNTITFEERQKQIEQEERMERENWENSKKSPFKNFVQMNKDYYKAEDWLMAKSPIAYRIFKFLINNMDGYNAVVCSQTVLQEQFEVSRVTVSRAIKLLKEKKYIDIFKSGTSNVYAVNKQIAWNSWGSNYRYAKFEANIILSESEQEESVKAKIKTVKHKEIILDEE
jgi:Fe2+ or Zn2+ uptake regulation protein